MVSILVVTPYYLYVVQMQTVCEEECNTAVRLQGGMVEWSSLV